jgi:hypothetical protein
LGWTDLASATPTLIGAADIAAFSISAEHIAAAGISADSLTSGTIIIKPEDGFAEGIVVRNAGGTDIGRWDEGGVIIYDPNDTSKYVLLDSAQISFNDGTGETAALTPDGLNASAINFGTAPGGHNLILNSSFELSDFVSASSLFTFTDNTDWVAGVRTSTDNMTEGATSLMINVEGY